MKLLPLLLLPLLVLPAAALEKKAPTSRNLRTPAQRWANGDLAEDPSFRRHVVPLLARAGCSGRECHGAFSGQGGFQLSLFGYHFDKDYEEITKDPEDGTRIDLKNPAQSLLLTKPALDGEKHKGKKRIDKGSWEYNILLKWVANGAKIDVTETGEFDRLEITPTELVFGKPGDTIPMRVLAHWKDGTVEDVTQITRFRTNDESVVEVSPTGVVTCKAPGDTHVVAFYDNGVHPIPAMLAFSGLTGPNFPKVPTRTKVDELVVAKLRKVGVVPSPLSTDAEFLRRASLDMTATLPTPEQVRAFLADTRPDKRAKKVEELLASPGYAAWWTTLLCDFGGNDPRRIAGPSGNQNLFSETLSRQWYEWIRVRLERNEPYDKIVAGMVLATGRTQPDQTYEDYAKEQSSYFCKTGAADFAQRPNMPYFWQRNNIRKPEEKALAFAHTFLGVRIECAQCHKHPFDQWTQTDFQQFQAFFEPIQYQAKPGPKDEVVSYQTANTAFKAALPPDKAGDQKYRSAEFIKGIENGTILPWPEVYISESKIKQVSPKEIARRKQKDPNFSGRVLTPKILGGDEVHLTQYPDPREPLMQWMRDKNNPYFGRAFVNRVWAQYFGRGMVEPADDMNLANPPVNRELMDYLSEGFVAHGYDIKWLHREIVNSDTYQRSWQTNETNKLDNKNFSHSTMRRLPAEVVFDAMRLATLADADQARFIADLSKRSIGSSTAGYKGQNRDTYALTTFGKPARNMNCDCERTNDPTLLQTLFTRNDPNFLQLLDQPKREDGLAWILHVRRATDADFSPEGIAKNLKRVTSGRDQRARQIAERMAKSGLKDKDLEKLREREVRTAHDIAGLERDLAQATERKPMPLETIIEDVFLRTVSRLPTADEKVKAREDIAAAPNQTDGVRDLLWAMLNVREFVVNH